MKNRRLEDEKMKEQALGRKLECEWLLEVFCGKGGMNHVQKKKEIAQ
jgi:hypothetical protein